MRHYSLRTRYRRISKDRGTVYFIANQGLVKIGFTRRSVKLRAKELNPNGPAFQIIAAVEGSHTVERSLHLRFLPLHVGGEWFKYKGALKQFLDELQSKVVAAEAK